MKSFTRSEFEEKNFLKKTLQPYSATFVAADRSRNF
jgi:hypothetical protein